MCETDYPNLTLRLTDDIRKLKHYFQHGNLEARCSVVPLARKCWLNWKGCKVPGQMAWKLRLEMKRPDFDKNRPIIAINICHPNYIYFLLMTCLLHNSHLIGLSIQFTGHRLFCMSRVVLFSCQIHPSSSAVWHFHSGKLSLTVVTSLN